MMSPLIPNHQVGSAAVPGKPGFVRKKEKEAISFKIEAFQLYNQRCIQ
jgi:hypothetical protein